MTVYWSCAQTHPCQEALSLRNLRRQRFTAFYPYFLEKNRFRKFAVKPVFPGYVFIKLDDQVPNWSPINNTLGVKWLLTYTTKEDEYRKPSRVPFMDDLRRLIIHTDNSGEDEAIPVGTTVRISRGPFVEKVALVKMSGHDRVKLLLEAFSREIVVDFSVDCVEIVRRPLDDHVAQAC